MTGGIDINSYVESVDIEERKALLQDDPHLKVIEFIYNSKMITFIFSGKSRGVFKRYTIILPIS